MTKSSFGLLLILSLLPLSACGGVPSASALVTSTSSAGANSATSAGGASQESTTSADSTKETSLDQSTSAGVRTVWNSEEQSLIDSHIGAGASALLPCYVPANSSFVDYWTDYETLSVEGEGDDAQVNAVNAALTAAHFEAVTYTFTDGSTGDGFFLASGALSIGAMAYTYESDDKKAMWSYDMFVASAGEETSSSEDTSASSSSSWSSSKVDVPEGWSGSFELKGDVVFKPADFPTAYDATPAEREIAGMKLSVQAVATFDKGVSLQFRKEASNKTPGILYNVAALSKAISDIKIVSGGAGTGFVNVLMGTSLDTLSTISGVAGLYSAPAGATYFKIVNASSNVASLGGIILDYAA